MSGFKRNSRSRKRIEIKSDSIITKIVIVISIIVIVLSIIILQIKENNKNFEIAKRQEQVSKILYDLYKETKSYEDIDSSDFELPDKVINIVSLGDILCETELYESVYDKTAEKYNFDSIFSDTKSYIEKADLAIASLETNFVDGEKISGAGKYNAPIELLDSIKDLGVDLINTANNHSFDYGLNGINSTINNLKARGIDSVGTYMTEEERDNIFIKDVGGIKIAFLSYTYGSNVNNSILKNNNYALNLIDKEKILNDMNKAKEEGTDFTFLLMHWGEVNSSNINKEQEELTDFLFENGADFILGTHPASIQQMEIRENTDGKNVFIAYSTGNYISASRYTNSNIEMLLDIQLTKYPEKGATKLTKVTYIPVYLLDRGKNAEQRYKLLDIRKEIDSFERDNLNNLSRDEFNELLKASITIDNLIYNRSTI